MMAVQAIAKNVRIAPRKVSVVASLIRGRTAHEAMTILEHTPRRSAIAVRKAVQSAVANANYNHGYIPESLRLIEISVTPGRRYRRFRPVSRGMAHPYQLKSSHIRVVVDGDKKRAKKAPTKKVDASERKGAK
jgi:large subunit ribosomal protein L22